MADQTYLQPIVCLRTMAVAGYQALAPAADDHAREGRSEGAGAGTTANGHCEFLQALKRSVLTWKRLYRGTGKLFVHVDPHCAVRVLTRGCPACELVEGQGVNPRDVVLEISERVCIGRDPALYAALVDSRQRGYRLALSEMGVGYAGLETLLLVRPDYVKFDVSLVRGIDRDSHRAVLMQSLSAGCLQLGVDTVAPGIETLGELETLRELGITLGMGPYVARLGEGWEGGCAEAACTALD